MNPSFIVVVAILVVTFLFCAFQICRLMFLGLGDKCSKCSMPMRAGGVFCGQCGLKVEAG